MKTMTIDQFLTPAEIRHARNLYRAAKEAGTLSLYAGNIEALIIAPNLAPINKALGQENDARYLAYAVEYVMSHA